MTGTIDGVAWALNFPFRVFANELIFICSLNLD
jgi:hypothetical protein